MIENHFLLTQIHHKSNISNTNYDKKWFANVEWNFENNQLILVKVKSNRSNCFVDNLIGIRIDTQNIDVDGSDQYLYSLENNSNMHLLFIKIFYYFQNLF